MFKIVIKKSAQKELAKLPQKMVVLIDNEILKLASQPKPVGSIKLQDKTNRYRIRVGDYRIIYSIDNDKLIVEIVLIRHRKEAYK